MRSLALLAVLVFPSIFACAQDAPSAPLQYAPAAPPGNGVLGYWSTNAGSVLHIDNCDATVCITVVTISQKAPGVIDGNNPDPALRTRPVCQMNIGTGFKLKDANHADGGRIYDPATGKTYKSVMSSDGNTLDLRGYLGFKAIGRSETWKRTTAEYATCVGTTHR